MEIVFNKLTFFKNPILCLTGPILQGCLNFKCLCFFFFFEEVPRQNLPQPANIFEHFKAEITIH